MTRRQLQRYAAARHDFGPLALQVYSDWLRHPERTVFPPRTLNPVQLTYSK